MQLLGNKCIIVLPATLHIRCRGHIVFLRINFIYSIHRQIDIFMSIAKKRYGGQIKRTSCNKTAFADVDTDINHN